RELVPPCAWGRSISCALPSRVFAVQRATRGTCSVRRRLAGSCRDWRCMLSWGQTTGPARGSVSPWRSRRPRPASWYLRAEAVRHAGDGVADLFACTRQVRRGQKPSNPHLVLGQQPLADPGRPPTRCHTLWAYSHVPPYPEGGWEKHRQRFADQVEQRVEGLP